MKAEAPVGTAHQSKMERGIAMMATETGRTTMNMYLDALMAREQFARYFTSDVRLQLMGTDQEARGREAVDGQQMRQNAAQLNAMKYAAAGPTAEARLEYAWSKL
jgi:hypothetical protein